MKKASLTLFAIATALMLHAQSEGIAFVYSFKEALTKAEKEGKLIFMDAYTTWCGPCKMLTKNVFPDKAVGEFYNNNFVNLKMDMEKGEGIQLSENYAVKAYPTLLFLDATGTLVHRAVGYHNIEQFMELGKKALDPSQRLSALEAKYRSGNRSADFLLNYAMARYDAMDGSHEQVAEEYLDTQKDWNSELNLQFIFRMISSIDSKMYDFLIKNRKAFDNLFGEQQVTGRIEQLIYGSIYDLGEQPDLQKVDAIFAKAYPEKASQFSARYRMRYYLETEDFDNYAQSAIGYFKKYPSKDASEYNNEAWVFYEIIDNKKQLKQAVKWAKKSVSLENAYFNNDTLAALYFKLGKKKQAKAAAERAIALAEKSGEDAGGTEELLRQIEKL